MGSRRSSVSRLVHCTTNVAMAGLAAMVPMSKERNRILIYGELRIAKEAVKGSRINLIRRMGDISRRITKFCVGKRVK
jgi:hypothetical protein